MLMVQEEDEEDEEKEEGEFSHHDSCILEGPFPKMLKR